MTTKYSVRFRRTSAFSLVEVVIAMAVITFCCVSLLGMLGNGLVTVNRAIGNTVSADIVQAMINSSQVASYSELVTNQYFGTTTPIQTFYYDNEGTAVPAVNAVYKATVTASKLNYPLTTVNVAPTPLPAVYDYTNSACLLKVTVVNQTSKSTPYYFSLLWSNSGQ